jgi:phosphate-selective porin OprO/OprP
MNVFSDNGPPDHRRRTNQSNNPNPIGQAEGFWTGVNMFPTTTHFGKAHRYLAALAAFAFLTTPARVQAQADAPAADAAAADTAAPTLDDVSQKIAILERKLELKDEEAQKKKDESAVVIAGKDGFAIKSADGDFQLKIRGTVQADARYFDLNDPGDKWANTFLLRRVDPVWEATAWKYYNFRVMAEFAGSSFSIQDAYTELNFFPEFKFRLGKFKAPIGLERLQSFPETFLIENAFPTYLTPNRDVGAQISGGFGNDAYNYALGVFNGAADNANKEIDSSDFKTVVGRVWIQPFKNGDFELLRGLGLGFAASYGKTENDSASQGTGLGSIRTPGQLTAFGYRTGNNRDTATARAFGEGVRLNPQAYWYWGPLGLLGEYVRSTQDVRIRQGGTGPYVKRNLGIDAWQVTGSWVLTGETPSYKGVKPRHPLAPKNSGTTAEPTSGFGGLGALELVGQVARFKIDEDAFTTYANLNQPRSATSYTGGLTWYLTSNVKWYFNYAFTAFEDGVQVSAAKKAVPAAGGNPAVAAVPAVVRDRAGEQVLLTRLQFSL